MPSFITVINPFSISSFVTFVIYKPGYGTFFVTDHPHETIYGADKEEMFFTEKFFGKERALRLWGNTRQVNSFMVVFGVAELPRLKTEEERLKAIHGIPGDARFSTIKALPLYYNAVNEERIRLGLGEVGK